MFKRRSITFDKLKIENEKGFIAEKLTATLMKLHIFDVYFAINSRFCDWIGESAKTSQY